MRLSIIIPCYNEERYLTRCLNSIKPNPDVEVLIIDDGSEDKSYDIAQEFTSFKAIKRTQTSFGVSFARNIGINEAQGEYITFLDADDEYCPDAIDNMLKELSDHEGEDIIQFEHNRPQCFNPSGYYKVTALPKKWVLAWNKVYRKDFLYEHGITFPYGLQFEEDRIFNLRCFNYLDGIVCVDPQTVIKHFDNKKSLCHSVDSREVLFLSEHLMGILTCSKPEVQAIARACLADLWRSKNAIRIFGGGDS